MQITSIFLSTRNFSKTLKIDVESWRIQLINCVSVQMLKKFSQSFFFIGSWWTFSKWQQKMFEFKNKTMKSDNFCSVLKMTIRSIWIMRLRFMNASMLNDMIVCTKKNLICKEMNRNRKTSAIKDKKNHYLIIINCEKQRVICNVLFKNVINKMNNWCLIRDVSLLMLIFDEIERRLHSLSFSFNDRE